MSYTVEFNDMEYDTGYGVHCGDLVIEVSPVFTDESFDAFNGAGVLQRYGSVKTLTGVELEDACLFLIGNNGVELGEVSFDSIEDLTKQYGITEDDLLEAIADRVDYDE